MPSSRCASRLNESHFVFLLIQTILTDPRGEENDGGTEDRAETSLQPEEKDGEAKTKADKDEGQFREGKVAGQDSDSQPLVEAEGGRREVKLWFIVSRGLA